MSKISTKKSAAGAGSLGYFIFSYLQASSFSRVFAEPVVKWSFQTFSSGFERRVVPIEEFALPGGESVPTGIAELGTLGGNWDADQLKSCRSSDSLPHPAPFASLFHFGAASRAPSCKLLPPIPAIACCSASHVLQNELSSRFQLGESRSRLECKTKPSLSL